MIEPERTSAVHLLAAVPAAAWAAVWAGYIGSFVAYVVRYPQGVSELLSELANQASVLGVGAMILWTLFLGAYVLPLVVIFGVPAYFLLRRRNKLTLSWSAVLGLASGILLGFVADVAAELSAAPVLTIWGGWVGLVAALAGYGVLRLLSLGGRSAAINPA